MFDALFNHPMNCSSNNNLANLAKAILDSPSINPTYYYLTTTRPIDSPINSLKRESFNYVVKELENKLVTEIELPGYKKEDLKSYVSPSIKDDNKTTLSIRGKSSISDKVCNHSIDLNIIYKNIDLAELKAKYDNGLLEITIPIKHKDRYEIGIT